jgi:protein gp37
MLSDTCCGLLLLLSLVKGLIFLHIKHKAIICEPLLEKINLSRWLSGSIEEVVVGGESGKEARICEYDWVFDIRNQCVEKKVIFHFKQTEAKFVKDGHLYNIIRQFQHSQAAKAGLNFYKL